ncbi:MAG: FeoB-associated Cys-rich membrane protein [Clostridia bacterium]|nr:FeoB-associated Cys-rich membrane protein [Clostridia bacterium]
MPNVWDIIIIAALALALFFAVRAILRKKGGTCTGGCACCAKRCQKDKDGRG